MNQHFRAPKLPTTTNADEGLMRRRWTVAEIEAAVAAGIIPENERFELIGGEVVPMAANGIQHETIKTSLMLYWSKRLHDEIRFAQETTIRMSVDTFLEPDFVFWPSSVALADLKPEHVLLAVEVADTSLGWDLGRKALLYASFAVREVWVINAVKHETHIFRKPGTKGYSEKRKLGPKKPLVPDFAPALSVRLDELALV